MVRLYSGPHSGDGKVVLGSANTASCRASLLIEQQWYDEAMYLPKHFEETRTDILGGLIRDFPLATLVTHSPEGLEANHIPLYFHETENGPGVLRGHIARANALSRYTGEGEVLAIFHGPQAYVSPSWYPTKVETGKVVPTWNYAVVHAYGTLRIVDDPAWLRERLNELTAQSEAAFATPWAVSDAPDEYIAKLLHAIVGIELTITRMTGKWKVSQNQPFANRAGVADGLRERGEEAMVNLVVTSSL